MPTAIFQEERAKNGTGKAKILALAVGEVLPVEDPHDLHKWQSLGRHYKVRFCKVNGGLRRLK